ncbi:MAG: nicotinate-nucleotide adenylyltransferase [Anaerolineae bacterium]|nr:nicotinate-nucleotide adenylyltransferase [Anaerolineae bacterium]
MRVGVLGGTFDPIHYGHLVIAEEARAGLQLSRVIFVPAKNPPHKLEQPHSDAGHRLRMVQLAIVSNPSFQVSEVDLARPGPSYTADTLALLRQQLGPQAALYFIMGMDSLANILTWHEPARVLAQAHLAVARRAGFSVDMPALESALPGISARTHFLDAPEIGICSQDLRRRVRDGLPIRYQLPEAVEAYIREHGLYWQERPAPEGSQGAGH